MSSNENGNTGSSIPTASATPSTTRSTNSPPTAATIPSTSLIRLIRWSRPARSLGQSFQKFDQVTERSEEHTSELQSHLNLVCRLLLEKKKKSKQKTQ